MKSTKYSTFCLKIFGSFFIKYEKEQLEEKNLQFVKANITMSFGEYYSMIIMNTILSFIFSLIFAAIIYSSAPNPFTNILLVLIPLLTPLCVFFIYFYYPN